MSVVEEENADRSDGETAAAGTGAAVDRAGAVESTLLRTLERSELEQPLVFFREGWEFRWMPGRQVLARLGLAEAGRTIVDERGDFEEPLELTEFLNDLEALLLGRTQAPHSTPDIEALAGELRLALRRRRPSMVLPPAEGADRLFALRLGLEIGAALILPPDPSTFVWAVCTTRPTIVAAGTELLHELTADLADRGKWRRHRLVSATRFVLELASTADQDRDPLSAMRSLMPAKTELRRIPLRSSS